MKLLRIAFGISMLVIGSVSCTKKLSGSGNYLTEQRTISSFTGIESEGDFNILIVHSNIPGLSITAEDNILPELETEVINGNLRIHFRRSINVRHGDITITASTNDLNLLHMIGSGSMKPQGLWQVDDLTCTMTGSGNIVADLEAANLRVNLAGSGGISLSGKSELSDLTVSGSGNIRTYLLLSRNARASVSGSGDIELTAREKLEATISGSGKIFYKGNPAELIQHINGSGKIIKQ